MTTNKTGGKRKGSTAKRAAGVLLLPLFFLALGVIYLITIKDERQADNNTQLKDFT